MSTPSILRHLYSLDNSSPDFLQHLYALFHHDEDERYLKNLQGLELARLVDFLDTVRTLPSAIRPGVKRAPQTLSAISADRDMSRRCLQKLQAICGYRSTLPSPYVISDGIVRAGRGPVTIGAVADVWEGTYRRKRVSIKCLKILPNDDQARTKVCV